MQSVSPHARSYDRTTIALHWITATLVAVQMIGAYTIDYFPRGALRVDARSVHIVLGTLLALVLVIRIGWRSTRGRRLPLADVGLLNLLAKGTHWALYGLLAVMVCVGLLLTWARGDSLFNLVSIPPLDPGNRALAHNVQEVHLVIGWTIVAVAGLHAAAALVHRYIWHDGVLARMLPRA